MQKLIELKKDKKHPTKGACHKYAVRVEWLGYEESEEQFSWEPLENMIDDVPDMAWPFILDKLGIEENQFIRVPHRKEIYF